MADGRVDTSHGQVGPSGRSSELWLCSFKSASLCITVRSHFQLYQLVIIFTFKLHGCEWSLL